MGALGLHRHVHGGLWQPDCLSLSECEYGTRARRPSSNRRSSIILRHWRPRSPSYLPLRCVTSFFLIISIVLRYLSFLKSVQVTGGWFQISRLPVCLNLTSTLTGTSSISKAAHQRTSAPAIRAHLHICTSGFTLIALTRRRARARGPAQPNQTQSLTHHSLALTSESESTSLARDS